MSFSYLNPFGDPCIKGQLIQVQNRSGLGLLNYCVYLPPNYDEREKYPVLYHLHGMGVLFPWMKREVLWTAVQLEKANTPMIVAAPHDPTLASMWVDGDAIQMAKSLHEHFIPEIETKYSIKGDRSSRFIQGFSMGGFGAALHGYKYQDMFGKVIVWDGELHDWDTLNASKRFIAKDQFANDQVNFHLWSPWAAARASSEVMKIRETPVFLVSGSLKQTRQLTEHYKLLLTSHGACLTHTTNKRLPHSLQPFMKAYGKEAIEFLTMKAL